MKYARRTLVPLLLLAWSAAPAMAAPPATTTTDAPAAKKRPTKGKPATPAPTPAPAPANVNVVLVNDRRGEPLPGLTLGLQFPDFTDREVAGERVVVRKAIDDTGASLLLREEAEKPMKVNYSGIMTRPDEKPTPLVVQLSLANPSRSATLLKEVSGELELFVPGRDPSATASIPRFLQSAGKPVANPALKANGVEVTVVTKAVLDADMKAAADKQRQKSIREGKKGEELEQVVSRVYDSFPEVENWTTLLKVADPKGRVQQFTYVDDKGAEIPVNATEKKGYTALFHGASVPGPEWTLRVQLRTDKTLVRAPFALKDVPLP